MAKKKVETEVGEKVEETSGPIMGLDQYLVNRSAKLSHYKLALVKFHCKSERHTMGEWDQLITDLGHKPTN